MRYHSAACLMLGLSTFGCGADRPGQAASPPPALSPPQCAAVKTAEQLIRENGFTASYPASDRSRIRFDAVERLLPTEEALRSRRNTLRPLAYGLLREAIRGKGSWIVVFRFTDEAARALGQEGSELKEKGRAVTVPDDGSAAIVEHADALLGAVQVRLQDRAAVAQSCGWQESDEKDR